MTILVVDIGNSRAKWALAGEGGLHDRGACAHREQTDWPQRLPRRRPAAVFVASVAGADALGALERHCGEAWGLAPQRVVSTAAACGVTNAYTNPERLGADRWLACVAAYQRARTRVLVVDAGTALTVDAVAANGRHLGGLIAPGVATMRTSLRAGTQLQGLDAPVVTRGLANDSDAAVASGSLQAALALIERARAAVRPRSLFLTGGEAPLLAPHLRGNWQLAPDLVLEGLATIAAERGTGCAAG